MKNRGLRILASTGGEAGGDHGQSGKREGRRFGNGAYGDDGRRRVGAELRLPDAKIEAVHSQISVGITAGEVVARTEPLLPDQKIGAIDDVVAVEIGVVGWGRDDHGIKHD